MNGVSRRTPPRRSQPSLRLCSMEGGRGAELEWEVLSAEIDENDLLGVRWAEGAHGTLTVR